MVEYDSDPGTRTAVGPADPFIGAVVGGYRIDFRIASGGFGAVYRGTHLASRVAVAIKVLHTQYSKTPDFVARFQREARILARLSDPHTVTAYGSGETREGVPWIAMELLSGESLYERFNAKGAMSWTSIVGIAREVCSSLAEAHAAGVVHRDLKPANILLELRGDATDYVKVIDFGIARYNEGRAKTDPDLTKIGQMIGTFDYMSPEQLVGDACTSASDIYTLGVVMFEMIAGVRPYPDARGPATLLASVLGAMPPALSMYRDVPAELDRILARCLAREPGARYSATELAEALHAIELDHQEDEITNVLVMPQLPLPAPPAVFEARGSEVIEPRDRDSRNRGRGGS